MPGVTESITITDNRSGNSIEIPIVAGGVDSAAWRKLLPGIWFHDPGLATTAVTSSAVARIDGEAGILRYRGYPIEQLAQHSTFPEVAYLLIYGELPTQAEHDQWVHEITRHTFIHENFRKRVFDAFHYDAHPMGLLTSGVAGLSTFYPEAKDIFDPDNRRAQIVRLIAKMPTLAAAAYRFSRGLPFIFPDNAHDYPTRFLKMMFEVGGDYEPDEALVRAMRVLFILHADHGQNCSTTAARVVGSSHADPYTSIAAGCAALYGPLHGGANEAVINMLTQIGTYDEVDSFIASVKRGGRAPADGIRAPRVALKLEEVALADDYFVSRRLYPNVDFYSGLIYQSLGFPTNMFTVLFAIGRAPGWLAHWNEMIEQNSRIYRPRQIYVGAERRDYLAMADR